MAHSILFKMYLIAVVALTSFGCLTFSSAKSIQMITSLPYSLGLANDIVRTGAAFDLAAENVNRKYGGFLNISVRHLFNASHRTCDEVAAQSAQMISSYYYNEPSRLDTCFAIATSREIRKSSKKLFIYDVTIFR
jgi:hypothetical protein